MSITIKKMIEEIIPKRSLKSNVQEQLKGVKGSIQIVAEGEDGGDWTLKIEDGVVEVMSGRAENPQCTLKAKAQTWVDLFNGKTPYMTALLFGKLKVQGDKMLAIKLTTSLLG